MIELDLEKYCQEGCMRFEPLVVRTSCHIDIRCEHAQECKYLLRYLTNHATNKEFAEK